MTGYGRMAMGSLAGAALAALAAPWIRPFFSVPTGGVGFVTVNAYPKGWDYAVVALIVIGAFAGGVTGGLRVASRELPGIFRQAARATGNTQLATAFVVLAVMLFLHDHPYAHMDPFHEGEHLTASWLLKSGERPYGDFFVFHGLATDVGLDALVMGDPPSAFRTRRLQTVLDAATLAVLVLIAAEVTATTAGFFAAVFASLCGMAALWLPVFPYFRLAPVLLATLALLRYARNGGAVALFGAFASATLGLLWSLDTGTYALAGTAAAFVVLRVFRLEARPLPLARVLVLALVALALPLLVLLAVRADIRQFFVDSFVIMPKAIDAVWALPAPGPFTANGVRYFFPLLFCGFLGALFVVAVRTRDRVFAARVAIVVIFSLLLFRTAAGRASWSHTRFAVPLLGMALIGFVLEPLLVQRKRVAAIVLLVPLVVYLEVVPNIVAGAKLLAGWRERQRHEGLVPFPSNAAKGIYTTPQNAADLAALQKLVDELGPGTILDFTNERALYSLLQRKPALRCMEISMLSAPPLFAEAMAQLNAQPPLCVIEAGEPAVAAYDGLSNRVRVPELAAWIDANYPRKVQVGRFTVAMKR